MKLDRLASSFARLTMIPSQRWLGLSVVCGLAMAGCGASDTVNTSSGPTALVLVLPAPQQALAPVDPFTEIQLRAYGVDESGARLDDLGLTWTSSSPGAASIDGAGLLTAHAGGATLVSVRHGDLVATTPIFVGDPVTEVFYDFQEDLTEVADSTWVSAGVSDPWHMFWDEWDRGHAVFRSDTEPEGWVLVGPNVGRVGGSDVIQGQPGLVVHFPRGAYLLSFEVGASPQGGYGVNYYFSDGSTRAVRADQGYFEPVVLEWGEQPLDSVLIRPGFRLDNFRFFAR